MSAVAAADLDIAAAADFDAAAARPVNQRTWDALAYFDTDADALSVAAALPAAFPAALSSAAAAAALSSAAAAAAPLEHGMLFLISMLLLPPFTLLFMPPFLLKQFCAKRPLGF